MSANLFPMMSKPKDSRIPVPLSPAPLRRSGSLRLRGESLVPNHLSPSTNQTARLQQDNKSALLTPGNSFMERGERHVRHGVSAAAAKSRNIDTTDSLNRKALKGAAPQSPSRIRSLVSAWDIVLKKGISIDWLPVRVALGNNLRVLQSLSLSTTRLSAPRSPSALTSSPKTPPTSPDVKNRSGANIDWDTESITSITSLTSVGSCDHASVARNGTTFSGRSMK